MNYPRALCICVAAAVLVTAWAGVGTASATTLCADTACTETYPAGTEIHLEAEGMVAWHTSLIQFKCEGSTYQGKITNAGGATETVGASVESSIQSSCSPCTYTVLKTGTWEIHTDKEDGRTTGEAGTLTSNGTEVTGFCNGLHCVWRTSNTSLGTITGGSPAKLDTWATFARVGGTSGALCGSSSLWTGSYKVTKPASLWVK